MRKFGYSRHQKLKSKTEISFLFNNGTWKTSGSVRIITLRKTESSEKIGVSVSKRNFKKAVDRNRIKRLLREAYRLHQDTFIQTFGSNSVSMLFWVSKKKPKHFKEVERDFLRLCHLKN